MKSQELTLKAIYATVLIYVCLISTSFASYNNPSKNIKNKSHHKWLEYGLDK